MHGFPSIGWKSIHTGQNSNQMDGNLTIVPILPRCSGGGGQGGYDKESAEGSNWVSQGGESESGQMVLKKVKWTYFDAYLCQTMWNNAKKSMKRLKRPNSLFLQGEVSSAVLKTWKTRETKTRITQNFQILNHIQGTTIGKLTSWGFRKCGSFCSGEFLKRRYWLSKSSNFSIFFKSKMRC